MPPRYLYFRNDSFVVIEITRVYLLSTFIVICQFRVPLICKFPVGKHIFIHGPPNTVQVPPPIGIASDYMKPSHPAPEIIQVLYPLIIPPKRPAVR